MFLINMHFSLGIQKLFFAHIIKLSLFLILHLFINFCVFCLYFPEFYFFPHFIILSCNIPFSFVHVLPFFLISPYSSPHLSSPFPESFPIFSCRPIFPNSFLRLYSFLHDCFLHLYSFLSEFFLIISWVFSYYFLHLSLFFTELFLILSWVFPHSFLNLSSFFPYSFLILSEPSLIISWVYHHYFMYLSSFFPVSFLHLSWVFPYSLLSLSLFYTASFFIFPESFIISRIFLHSFRLLYSFLILFYIFPFFPTSFLIRSCLSSFSWIFPYHFQHPSLFFAESFLNRSWVFPNTFIFFLYLSWRLS